MARQTSAGRSSGSRGSTDAPCTGRSSGSGDVHWPLQRLQRRWQAPPFTPLVGRERFGVLSMHLNNVHAKKRVAGPGEVARVLDEARVLEHLESRDFMPIADYVHVRAPCGNF